MYVYCVLNCFTEIVEALCILYEVTPVLCPVVVYLYASQGMVSFRACSLVHVLENHKVLEYDKKTLKTLKHLKIFKF